MHYYALRVIKYFGKPPAIEDTFNSAIQTFYDDEKFTGFKDIQADIHRYVQEYSSFNANISFPIKFVVISPVG